MLGVIDELLERNAGYAARFDGELPPQPAKQLAVVACMDSRIEPWAAFGLSRGEAHVLRNAGARVTDDVVRSLVVSVHLLGVKAIAVVGHTGCGLTGRGNSEIAAAVESHVGVDLGDYDFLVVDDINQAVQDDAARLRRDPLFAGVEVGGLLFDIATGRLTRLS
ncbi:MAG: carbonic anhydrase [Frankiales bacterium]|jgi:carbonic anhydrase|nr:carbonic anhydrase [Frankiales bacterium]